MSDAQLQALIGEFLSADIQGKRRLLESEEAALFGPRALATLRALAQYANRSGDDQLLGLIETHERLLAACRSSGVAAAFNELENGPSSSRPQQLLTELESLEIIPDADYNETNLRHREALLNKLTDAVPRSRDPISWAVIQNKLGNVLASLGELTNDTAALEKGERAYLAATDVWTLNGVPSELAVTQNNLGTLLSSLGKMTGNVSALERAKRAFQSALLVRPRESAPSDWAMTQNNLGNTLQLLGEQGHGPAALAQAERAYRSALLVYTRENEPLDWAMTQRNLGACLACMGELMGDATALGRAEEAFNAALSIYTREATLIDWARTQYALGTVLSRLGTLTNDVSTLERAERAFQDTLVIHTREVTPIEWAGIQHDLGSLLEELGRLNSSPEVLGRAERAFHNALLVRTRESTPFEWAATKNNLGVLLARMGELDSDKVTLKRAEQAYRDALSVRTREVAPKEWATTEDNLGSLLASLGDLVGDIAMLRQAEQAYCNALLVRTRQDMPHDWAKTQCNRGIVLQRLGEFRGDAAVLKQAEQAFRDALTVVESAGNATERAIIQNNLGNVLVRLGEIMKDLGALEQAEQTYREALSALDRKEAPLVWGATQDHLGTALLVRGTLTSDAASLGRAAQACSAALSVRTFEATPSAWAMSQSNLASVLNRLGTLIGDATTLTRAEQALRAALRVYTRDAAPVSWATVQHNLGNVLANLGSLTGDALTFERAERAYHEALLVRGINHEESARQRTAVALAHLLTEQSRYAEASILIDETLRRSDTAIQDVSRSEVARMEAVSQVEDLYGLLSLCRLRQVPPDRHAALEAAEAGRARLLAYALALDETLHGSMQTPEELSADQILAAAPRGGALVLPVVTQSVGFVFIAIDGATKPKVLELGNLNMKAVLDHLNGEEGWLGAYNRVKHAIRGRPVAQVQLAESPPQAGTASPGTVAKRPSPLNAPPSTDPYEAWNDRLRATQTWLWSVLLGHVHTYLRQHLGANAPVILLPPGLLGLLPLQSAGPGPDGQYFCDHWTVSLAPSARTLMACRERLARPATDTLLAVIDPSSLPEASGHVPARLAGAWLEAEMLRQRLPTLKHEMLEDMGARLAAVLEHLPEALYFHASTHGSHHPVSPERSSLTLANGEALELRMLREARLAARLVYLSACETGLAGVYQAANEYVGLPTGFVQAGAAGVVGSLWPVFDDASFLIADKFYELYLGQGGQPRMAPAEALREAQRGLRTLTYRELKRRFPVLRSETGEWCVAIGAAPRKTGTQVAPGATMYLQLGADDACPFRQPYEWAAYTFTGV